VKLEENQKNNAPRTIINKPIPAPINPNQELPETPRVPTVSAKALPKIKSANANKKSFL